MCIKKINGETSDIHCSLAAQLRFKHQALPSVKLQATTRRVNPNAATEQASLRETDKPNFPQWCGPIELVEMREIAPKMREIIQKTSSHPR